MAGTYERGKRTEIVCFRATRELAEWLESEAAGDDRSISYVAYTRLDEVRRADDDGTD